MKFNITDRWTGNILFTAELDAKYESEPRSIQMGAAVKLAVSSGSNLRGSDLSGSDLRGSDLSGSNLRDSNLSDSDLRGSDLSGSNLRDSNLSGSDLSGSNLRDSNLSDSDLSGSNLRDSDLSGSNLRDSDLSGSDLRGSDLSGSNLRDSNLSDSNLSDSDLRGSNLRDSNLSGSDLSGSNLSGSDLSDSDLSGIRDDLWAVLSGSPAEVPALRQALIEGRVDGSTYTGECACLCGTLANAKGVSHNELEFIEPDSSRLAEVWFNAIKKGDTPDTNPTAKQALEWVDQWLANVAQLQKVAA